MSCQRRVITSLVALVVGLSAVAFAWANGASVRSLLGGVGSINLAVAVLGIACSALAMGNRGLLNRAAHRAVGLDAGVGAMTQTAAVGFAAQKMVKSAGAVGLVVFLRHGRRRGHAPHAVAAACLLTASASFVAMGVLVGAALIVLAVTGSLTGWWIAAAIAFAVYALVVVPTAVMVMRNRRAAVWAWRGGQRIRRLVPWRKTAAGHDEAPFPTALLDAFAHAKRRPDAVRELLFHAVVSKLLGALALAAAIAAVGLPITAAGALVIYATALAASLLTIVPGGIGTVEASTAALLIGAGATAGAAALAVALFRLFDLWLPVLTGAAVARRDVKRHGRSIERAATSCTVELARLEHWAAAGSHL